MPISKSSEKRIKRFVDWFIRSECVEALTSDRDCDFINKSDRAERCYDAAEDGADGKTHAEVIGDWRDAFENWIRDTRKWKEDPDRFIAAVNAHFDRVEDWHDKHGSLHQQIG
jgi:hypothetical protein